MHACYCLNLQSSCLRKPLRTLIKRTAAAARKVIHIMSVAILASMVYS